MESSTPEPTGSTFGGFPLEILLYIASHLPAVPYPCTDPGEFLQKTTYHRSQTLLALSQTCFALRATLLGWYWETFEVGMGAESWELMLTKEKRQRRLLREMKARCRMVLENQEMAKRVRCVI
jgi:hypothetical protein